MPLLPEVGEGDADSMSEQHGAAEVLSVSAAWALMRQEVVGRVCVVVEEQPDIFPVNFLVDHGSIVFRTAAGTKLAAAIGKPVAFEVDSYELSNGEAWSVVVKGTAREVVRLHELIDSLELPLFPWHAAPKPQVVRIEPTMISGRRFRALAQGGSAAPAPRRSAHE